MKRHVLLAVLLCFCSCFLQAKPKIVFNSTERGYPPFLINEQSGKTSGIIFDVLFKITSRLGYDVEVIRLPKMRIELHMKKGKLDASASAKEWVEDADQYIFSDIILSVRDLVVSNSNHILEYENVASLFDKTISIRHGYYYPELDDYLATTEILAVPENSEFAMLKSVLYERTDAAVINETVAKWIIRNNPSMSGRFNFSRNYVSSFDYRMMFTKKWRGFLESFNRELALMKKNGELKEIISRYE